MRVVITGGAGFIGYHLAKSLIQDGHEVISFDNLNDYYSRDLKCQRVILLTDPRFTFVDKDIRDLEENDFAGCDAVVHLAAQAGVRYSLVNPQAYIDANITGFLRVLELVKDIDVPFLYASSSSVYGKTPVMPFVESMKVNNQGSLYGVTKAANELMAQSYFNLYGLQSVGLRFFTVYGPWGRPDMALYLFAEDIAAGREVPLFNNGKHKRDWTHVDDIVSGIRLLLTKARDFKNPEIFNLCSGDPRPLTQFTKLLAKYMGAELKVKHLPMQQGDTEATWGSNEKLKRLGWKPLWNIERGIDDFVHWFNEYTGKF